MRIAQVCPYSLSVPGGVQQQVLGLSRVLRRMGHEARVLAPCDGPPPEPWVTPLGRSLPYATNGSVAPIAPDPACVLRTLRALRDETFDIVHLHEPLVPGPSAFALLMTEAPIVATFHRSGFAEEYDWLRPLTDWSSENIDIRCAVSGEAATTAHQSLGGEYEIVFNGIELERFRNAQPWPTEGPTVLFVGRHEPRKGLDVLLRALPDLPTNVRLWVAGLGPQTAELRAAYPDSRIDWLGSVSDAQLAGRLRGAHVLCAPSLGGESFGIVLVEGMASEAVVVASDIPGYHNAARADVDALFVAPNDPHALAAGIMRALSDDELRARLIAGGRQRAESFSMQALAERYLEIYDRVGTGAAAMTSLRRPTDPFGRGLRWVGWRRGGVRSSGLNRR